MVNVKKTKKQQFISKNVANVTEYKSKQTNTKFSLKLLILFETCEKIKKKSKNKVF